MKNRLFFCFVIGILFSITNAYATTYTWAGGAAGNWTTATNWAPNSGYPGKTGTTDIAIFGTSNVTATLTTTLTIATLETTSYGISGIIVSVSTGATLNIGSGVSTAQPASASNVFTFAGAGTTKISGTISAGYQASFAISSGATVYFNASSIFDESTSNPHGNLTNAGTLNVLSGAALKFGDFASLINTGTIHSYSATYTFSGSGSPASTISNSGTFIDHGSSISLTGQNAAFLNSTAATACTLNGTTITASSGNNGMSITNAGAFTADSVSVITLGTQNMPITNTGTFKAGMPNSPCTINLTGQGSNINNTGTFLEGSTSVIAPSGTSAKIANSGGGTFTLQSDANGSATISALSSTASVTGNYNVQRYLQGGVGYRSYRLLSSQVFTINVSSANVYSINYLQNSIYLTGTTLAAGGFDVGPATTSENPTLYLYTETIINPQFTTFLNSNFVGIDKINNTIPASYAYSMNASTPAYASTYYIPVGSGFLCFFRGDRSTSFAFKTTAPFPVPENTTLTTTGAINNGTLTARNWFNQTSANLSYTAATNAAYRGFNLVGNPYPSTIDWETYSNTAGSGIYVRSVSKSVYELNPQTQNFDVYQKGGAFTNNGSRYIASGQGFFVLDTLATVAFLGFNESAKVNNQNTGANLFMGTPDQQTANSQYLRLQLAMDNINTDDIMLRFNSGVSSHYNGDLDAPYKVGMGKVSLSSFSGDHIALAINTRSLPKNTDTVGLAVSTSTDGIYSLNMKQLVGIPQLFDIWLMDNYKRDSLDMRHNLTYSFNVTKSDTNSFGSKRFSLIIRQNPAFAYHLLSFTAAKDAAASNSSKQVQISWTTENEQNYTYFTVERSTDKGNTYQVAGSVTASGLGKYSLIDENPTASNLYRLKSVDINGAITYSNIVPIIYTSQTGLVQNVIGIYPNPVAATINLFIAADSNSTDTYNITITNSSGLLVKHATSSQPSWQASAGDLLPGTYVVKVFSNKTQAEVGNTKFVKL